MIEEKADMKKMHLIMICSTGKSAEKRDLKEAPHLNPLGLGRGGMDFPHLGTGLPPSLEVLQSLYGQQPGEPRDVLASVCISISFVFMLYFDVHVLKMFAFEKYLNRAIKFSQFYSAVSV